MRKLILFVAAAIFAAFPAQAQEHGVVIGYIAAFKGLDHAVREVDLKNYTHVDIAFVNPTPAGEVAGPAGLVCAPGGDGAMISDASLRGLVASAHASGTKVIASLAGAEIPPCGADWNEVLRETSRATLVTNLIGMVDRYNLDGIDIDIEGELLTGIDKAGNYTPFVRALAEALHARSKLLTAATASYSGGMVPDASLPYFDLIGIMSYDGVGPTWGTPGGEHSTYAQAEADLRLWLGKGVPASKLALGMPFYGHGFGTYATSWPLHDIAARFGKGQLNGDVAGERCGGCSYITYNGLPTLERKAALAGAWGVGVMVWEVEQDLPGGQAIRHIDAALKKGRAIAQRR